MEALRRLADAVEERTGARTLLRHLLDEKVPGGARFAYVFGSVLLALLGIQLVSGLLLASEYAPTTSSAHESLTRLMDPEQAPWGAFVRGLHHFGASFLIVALVLHVAQVAIFGAYRAPREVNWLSGLALGGLLLAFGFTGYLLPWDQTAYYATRVGLNIMRGTPGGVELATILQGGPVMGNLTLTRFYTIHVVVLPLALGGLVLAHLLLFRRHGVTTAPGLPAAELEAKSETFWPWQAFKDTVVILVIVGALLALAALVPAPLGDKADPSQPFDARPEWYFYWLFQLLHYFEPPWDWVGTMAIPAGLGAFFALLPWLDRKGERTWRQRLRPAGAVLAIFLAMGVLTLQVVANDRAGALQEADSIVPATLEVDVARVTPVEAGLLFGEKCTECHGPDGAARDPDAKDFRSPEFKRMARTGQADMIEYVKTGGEIMPAFADELTDAQIRAILKYVVLAAEEKDVPLHSAE